MSETVLQLSRLVLNLKKLHSFYEDESKRWTKSENCLLSKTYETVHRSSLHKLIMF